MPTVDSGIIPVEDEAGVAACFSLMQQLRPSAFLPRGIYHAVGVVKLMTA